MHCLATNLLLGQAHNYALRNADHIQIKFILRLFLFIYHQRKGLKREEGKDKQSIQPITITSHRTV